MRFLPPMMVKCLVCKELRRSNSFGTVVNEVFSTTFNGLVCDDCCALCYMVFEETVDAIRADTNAEHDAKIRALGERMLNAQGIATETRSPRSMVDDLLRGTDGNGT